MATNSFLVKVHWGRSVFSILSPDGASARLARPILPELNKGDFQGWRKLHPRFAIHSVIYGPNAADRDSREWMDQQGQVPVQDAQLWGLRTFERVPSRLSLSYSREGADARE